jgi:hypothetical protein
MEREDFIIQLYEYFARFVPKDVLKATFIQPAHSQFPGYAQIRADVLALPDDAVIPEFDTYTFSINENFVSERIRNSKKFLLFVEYGRFSLDFTKPKGVQENLRIIVARNFSDGNNNNLQEVILMNRCLELLQQILFRMNADRNELNFCSFDELLHYPVEVMPFPLEFFYGCGGWIATFNKVNTLIS